MRKLLLTILTVALLGGGAAFAQGQWAGVSLGNPAIQGYYGMENALGEDIHVRARLGLHGFWGGGFVLGADALFDLTTFGDQDEFQLYAGGGPSISYLSRVSYDPVTDTWSPRFGFDVSALIGLEFELDASTSIFAEAGAGIGTQPFLSSGRGSLGINFNF